MSASPRVYLGACDWRHPEWVGTFYPGDMPEEWRLAFFQTQYSCVWLGRAMWEGASEAEVSAWLDDTREDFHFLLQSEVGAIKEARTPSMSMPSHARMIADADARIIWFDRNTGLDTLVPALRLDSDTRDIHLVSRDAHLDKIHEVSALLELLGM